MIRQLFTVSTMIMALGMTPTQAFGGVTRIQETNQSKNGQCTGTIIDPTGEPVIGATVTVKGKQGGVPSPIWMVTLYFQTFSMVQQSVSATLVSSRWRWYGRVVPSM